MAEKKKKDKTGEKKHEYHLKDYLTMCKVQSQILDFAGLSVSCPEEWEEALEQVPGTFRRQGEQEPVWLEKDRSGRLVP
jgi:hypothetical protein